MYHIRNKVAVVISCSVVISRGNKMIYMVPGRVHKSTTKESCLLVSVLMRFFLWGKKGDFDL